MPLARRVVVAPARGAALSRRMAVVRAQAEEAPKSDRLGKAGLVEALQNAGLTKQQATLALDTVFDTIKDAVKQGDRCVQPSRPGSSY